MRRKDARDQLSPGGGERQQGHPAVAAARPPAHQAPLHELVDDIGRAARLHQDAPLHLAHRELALVIQHLEHAELGRAERSEEHTSELQSLAYLVCRLLLEKKKKKRYNKIRTALTDS